MKEFYIYHHLGMGDHLICNAIVRNICKKYLDKQVVLFCEPKFEESVKFMYRDVPNLSLKLGHDPDIQHFLDTIPQSDKIYVGHQNLVKIRLDESFDEVFYRQIGLSMNKRWDDFLVVRDTEREHKLYNIFNPVGEYIFLHEDPIRGYYIDRNHIKNKGLQVISPVVGITNNIFDYLYLIENAKEIHCMDSSFWLMTDSIIHNRSELNFHFKMLGGRHRDYPYAKTKLTWKAIE